MENINEAVVQPLRPRGFAAMTAEQRSTIASMGGRAAHLKGTAHQFTSAEAIAAGKLRAKVAKEKLLASPDVEAKREV